MALDQSIQITFKDENKTKLREVMSNFDVQKLSIKSS